MGNRLEEAVKDKFVLNIIDLAIVYLKLALKLMFHMCKK
jgi:hypothetical protein